MANDLELNQDDIENVARRRFNGLTTAEERLLRAAPAGEFAYCGPTVLHKDNDPSKADSWGDERTIRAALIRWLCVDPNASKRIDPRGVRLFGALILNSLDLSFVTVPFLLGFYRCRLSDDANLMGIKVPRLDFDGSFT